MSLFKKSKNDMVKSCIKDLHNKDESIQLAAALALKNSTDPRVKKSSVQERIDAIILEEAITVKLLEQLRSSPTNAHGASDQAMLSSSR